MPNNPNSVTLDVRNFSSPANSGYTNINGSNGLPYSYQFTGGGDGSGDSTFTIGGGQAAITISISQTDSRYDITGVNFNGTGTAQFRNNASANGRTTVIIDSNNAAANVEYTVVVTDSTAKCTVNCDPQVINH